MISRVEKQIGDTTVPLELWLQDNGGKPITGQTVEVSIRRLADNYFLDFSDDTFKASGWTTKNQALTEVTGVNELSGLYRYVWDSSSAITSAMEVGVVYKHTDITPDGLTPEVLEFTHAAFADKILKNRLEINRVASTLVLYDDDGTTALATWPLTDKDGGAANLNELNATLVANRGAQS